MSTGSKHFLHALLWYELVDTLAGRRVEWTYLRMVADCAINHDGNGCIMHMSKPLKAYAAWLHATQRRSCEGDLTSC
jgi:hypothetical protein